VRLLPRRTASFLVAALIALTLAGAGDASAACVYPSAYPGDSGAKQTIAAWMAGGAQDAGLPGELPVMGALVASGLRHRMTAEPALVILAGLGAASLVDRLTGEQAVPVEI
jgi:hypothetical protein